MNIALMPVSLATLPDGKVDKCIFVKLLYLYMLNIKVTLNCQPSLGLYIVIETILHKNIK